MKILIQSVLVISKKYRQTYWQKIGDNPANRISKAKFFELYDKVGDGNVEMLPPITKEE